LFRIRRDGTSIYIVKGTIAESFGETFWRLIEHKVTDCYFTARRTIIIASEIEGNGKDRTDFLAGLIFDHRLLDVIKPFTLEGETLTIAELTTGSTLDDNCVISHDQSDK